MSGERPDSMAKLIVGEAAEAEYAAAVDWYAAGSLAAADGFTEAVAAAFRRILDRPEWGAACDDAHRLVIVRGYPYQIIYRMAADNSTLVIAVAHCSRRPDYWLQR
ncbi:MAG: type II toxin-antitoxin system RelE/ParE family toxin [Planctomycetia bacterium]